MLSTRSLGRDDAAQTLVAHPGGPGMSSAYFGDLCGLAGRERRVVLVDPRGTGAAPRPADGNYDLEQYAADLDALREKLGVAQIDLLGHSHGGFVAQAYATLHPDRVRRLILLQTVPRFSPQMRDEAHQAFERHAGAPWYEDAVAAQRERQQGPRDDAHGAALYRREMRLWFADGDGPAYRELIARIEAVPPNIAAAAWFNQRVAPTFDMRDRLGSITAPTLVVNGECDWLGPQISALELSAIPDSRALLLPDCGHWAFLEQPDAFRGAVEEFLSG